MNHFIMFCNLRSLRSGRDDSFFLLPSHLLTFSPSYPLTLSSFLYVDLKSCNEYMNSNMHPHKIRIKCIHRGGYGRFGTWHGHPGSWDKRDCKVRNGHSCLYPFPNASGGYEADFLIFFHWSWRVLSSINDGKKNDFQWWMPCPQ